MERQRRASAPPELDEISASEGFKIFRTTVPRNKVSVDPQNSELEWTYYDAGPKKKIPLICLPGASGTAEAFFRQVMVLSARGYRVISAQYPAYYTYEEFVVGFDRFLDALQLQKVHLYGVSLGGFLAQVFCEARPERILSLVLTNSFIDTTFFSSRTSMTDLFSWMPEFYLKKLLLESFPQDVLEPMQADAVDFMVNQLESLTGDDVAARLTMNCSRRVIGLLALQPDRITVMNTLDRSALPQILKQQMEDRYAKSRWAFLKSGGDFPFIAAAEEVNLHLQVHLRHCEQVDGLQ